MSTPLFRTMIPTNDDVAEAVQLVRATAPELGAAKVLAALKDVHPDWALSEQRLRKIMKEHGLGLPHPSATPVPAPAASIRLPAPGAPDFYRPNDRPAAPVLPRDARAEQLRYQAESRRCYKLYGRGTTWDYGVTWNADMQLMVNVRRGHRLCLDCRAEDSVAPRRSC